MATQAGFRITANQVTIARLIPMPLLSYWVYLRTENYLWAALVCGTVVGCTDFVDGWLARKHGPTVLGGLLDPISDKVFVAFAYVPFADMGIVPASACALMFIREFLVTALRSAYEQRNVTLKTSYLGKAKTWTQMQGIGVLVLVPLIGDGPVLAYLLWFGAIFPIVAMAALWFIKRKFWRGAVAMSASFLALIAVLELGGQQTGLAAIMIGIVAITWLSALDYFIGGMRQLRGRGDLGANDMVRILGSIGVPTLGFIVLTQTSVSPWPILTILAFELAVGGLDNLLSHHRVASSAWVWGSRVFSICAALIACLALDYGSVPPGFVGTTSNLCSAIAWMAAAIAAIGAAAEFWRGRDYFMDARLRRKAATVNT